jgi:hypothetical protein
MLFVWFTGVAFPFIAITLPSLQLNDAVCVQTHLPSLVTLVQWSELHLSLLYFECRNQLTRDARATLKAFTRCTEQDPLKITAMDFFDIDRVAIGEVSYPNFDVNVNKLVHRCSTYW